MATLDLKKKRAIYLQARKGKYALGAFNFSEIAQLRGIVAAGKKTGLPFMIETSEGESKYLGLDMAVTLKQMAEKELGRPIILNLDHGKSFEHLKKAIAAGYDMVHFDGAGLPLEENIRICKSVVEYAHKREVLVEGEVGVLRGASRIHREKIIVRKEDMTHPEEAKEFVERTGVDFFASVIGNLHGICVGSTKQLDLKRLAEINAAVGSKAFLSLHGGSGIPPAQIKKAIERGIAKININTEVRMAWRGGIEKVFKSDPDEVAPSKMMPLVIEEIQRVAEKKMMLFSERAMK